MNLNIASFRFLNKQTASKMVEEDELLTEIAMVSSLKTADKYKNEFHSKYNIYSFELYLDKLERVKWMLMRGFNNTELIIRLIRTNADCLIR